MSESRNSRFGNKSPLGVLNNTLNPSLKNWIQYLLLNPRKSRDTKAHSHITNERYTTQSFSHFQVLFLINQEIPFFMWTVLEGLENRSFSTPYFKKHYRYTNIFSRLLSQESPRRFSQDDELFTVHSEVP